MKPNPKTLLKVWAISADERQRFTTSLRAAHPDHHVRSCLRQVRAFGLSIPVAVVAIYTREAVDEGAEPDRELQAPSTDCHSAGRKEIP